MYPNRIVYSVNQPSPPSVELPVAEVTLTKYQRNVLIGDTAVVAQIDPGSCDCLITSSHAIQSGQVFQPSTKIFSGLGEGNTVSLGSATIPITIDEITINVPLYVVPDAALPVPLIIGRTWTDDPSILYVRLRGELRFLRHDEFAAQQLAEMAKLKLENPTTVNQRSNFVDCVIDEQWPDDSCVLLSDDAAYVLAVEDNRVRVPLRACGSPTVELPAETTIGSVLRIQEAEVVAAPTESDALFKPFALGARHRQQIPTRIRHFDP
ncbi:hypothetical protein U1Q18_051010 [Sarracenia purpurea var. burkii]